MESMLLRVLAPVRGVRVNNHCEENSRHGIRHHEWWRQFRGGAPKEFRFRRACGGADRVRLQAAMRLRYPVNARGSVGLCAVALSQVRQGSCTPRASPGALPVLKGPTWPAWPDQGCEYNCASSWVLIAPVTACRKIAIDQELKAWVMSKDCQGEIGVQARVSHVQRKQPWCVN